MKSLIFKQADDKKYCLFEWDSAQKFIFKRAEGKIAKQLDKYASKFLLGDDEHSLKVYTLSNSEIQVISVRSQNVNFVGSFCTYEDNGKWYCSIQGKEILLGERRTLELSIYNMLRTNEIPFYYFVLGNETEEFVLSVIVKSKLISGRYYGELLVKSKDYIFAKRKDGNYDVFTSFGSYIYGKNEIISQRYIYDDLSRVYFWDETKVSWKRLTDDKAYVWADNAVQINYQASHPKESYVVLYEVCGVDMREAARGRFVMYSNGSFRVGDKVFYNDYGRNMVDFNYSYPTFFQRLRGFR